MEYRPLGDTDIQVSAICLGTMTFGEQNTASDAYAQLDLALDAGVNFIDTAEMYSIPPRADTMGRTEEFIGSWLAKRKARHRVVLATKVAGPGGDWLSYIRGGNNHLDKSNIQQAVDASLQRLGTDVIDLYQLHWPERETNYFGRLGYTRGSRDDGVPLRETLEAMNDLIVAGKVRTIGVSNETPWGVMEYLRLAERHDLGRIVSIQNPYNLLNRSFEIGLAEIAHREQVGLMAYSPLAFGVLSGKYLGGSQPAGARLTLFKDYTRYSNPQAVTATEAYVQLARAHGLDPAQMALAYVNSRPFATTNIVGATNLEQLQTNIDSVDLNLSTEVLEGIEAIHVKHPNPSP